MKNTISLAIFILYTLSAYSQIDSTIYLKYEEKIIENHILKTELLSLKENYADLRTSYSVDTTTLKSHIKELDIEILAYKQQILNLSKNNLKYERDSLQIISDSLKKIISVNAQIIQEKEKELNIEKENTKKAFLDGEKQGKNEVLTILDNTYTLNSFDELISSSTKETINRDLALINTEAKHNPVLNDLKIYFNAAELLSAKYDEKKLNAAEVELNGIERSSKLLKSLQEDISNYSDYSQELKETISRIIQLDKEKLANNDSEIQERKFSEIVTIITEYMYDNSNYRRYPYISNILFEILDRKYKNADASIVDLLEVL